MSSDADAESEEVKCNEDDEGRVEDQLRRADWKFTTFNLLAVMFGATQLPYSMGQMGWRWGLGFIAASSLSTWSSGRMIGEACLATGAKSYPELGRKAFGVKGQRFIVVCQWLSYFLTGVTQIAYSGAGYQQTLRGQSFGSSLCTEGWMLVTVLALAPCIMVPSFEEAVGLSLIVVFAQIFGIVVMFEQIGANGSYRSEGLCYNQISMSSILATVSNTAFAYGGHGVIPELIREMRNPEADYYRAFDASYLFAVPMYILTACVGFYAFGNAAAANFVENLRAAPAVRAYLWINSLAVFPLVVVNQVALFLNVEISLGILPTDVWTNSLLIAPTTNDPEEPPDDYLPLTGESKTDQSQRDHDTKLTPKQSLTLYATVQSLPPILVRFTFRLGYLFSMYLVAYMLIGAGLGDLTDLAGSLGIAALTYWAPYILHAKVFWNRYTRSSLVWAILNASFGLFVTCVGTYYAVKDIIKNDVVLFQEDSCQEGAYFWGNSLWSDKDLITNTSSSVYKYVINGCCNEGSTCGT